MGRVPTGETFNPLRDNADRTSSKYYEGINLIRGTKQPLYTPSRLLTQRTSIRRNCLPRHITHAAWTAVHGSRHFIVPQSVALRNLRQTGSSVHKSRSILNAGEPLENPHALLFSEGCAQSSVSKLKTSKQTPQQGVTLWEKPRFYLAAWALTATKR